MIGDLRRTSRGDGIFTKKGVFKYSLQGADTFQYSFSLAAFLEENLYVPCLMPNNYTQHVLDVENFISSVVRHHQNEETCIEESIDEVQ